jgi:hypothetical protein
VICSDLKLSVHQLAALRLAAMAVPVPVAMPAMSVSTVAMSAVPVPVTMSVSRIDRVAGAAIDAGRRAHRADHDPAEDRAAVTVEADADVFPVDRAAAVISDAGAAAEIAGFGFRGSQSGQSSDEGCDEEGELFHG